MVRTPPDSCFPKLRLSPNPQICSQALESTRVYADCSGSQNSLSETESSPIVWIEPILLLHSLACGALLLHCSHIWLLCADRS